jgi:SGNH hydrolase-like domain, acetyltransferase AlgX
MNQAPPGDKTRLDSKTVTLTREAEAQRDLSTSSFSRGAKSLLMMGFLTLLCAGVCAPLFLSGPSAGEAAAKTTAAFARLLPTVEAFQRIRTVQDLWRWLPSPAATHEAEKALEENAVLAGRLRPLLQEFLVRLFGEGNQQVVVARSGGLFYRKDIDYVNGRSFLDPIRVTERSNKEKVAADPLPAVADFQKQLAARGIRLVLLPVPVKPCVEGHQLGGGRPAAIRLRQNAAFAHCVEQMRDRGVEVFDCGPLLLERLRHSGEAQYLAADTHWTPGAMEAVARAVAEQIAPESTAAAPPRQSAASVRVSAPGDTLALLGLPKEQTLFAAQTVEIHPVMNSSDFWKPSPTADVLLLGDSFSNIYSLSQMGWGEGAGFAEQLSAAMGRPVDALLRNSDGAFAGRQMLQHELAMGRDRLAGKKVVVWEFAVRELAFGDWKLLPLELGPPPLSGFYCPPRGQRVWIEGTVVGVSPVPRPGSVPYKEHIMSVRLADVVAGGARSVGECLVYTWSLRDQQLTAAGRLRPGDRVRWEVCAWDEVQGTREKFQRSEFEEPALLLESFVWVE